MRGNELRKALKDSIRLVDNDPLDTEIERALIQRKQALEALAWADEELLPLRKEYARRRGEFMLPAIERLRREFGLR